MKWKLKRALGRALLVCAGLGPLQASAQPDVAAGPSMGRVNLDAEVLVESKVLGADGILRSTRFTGTLMRREAEVWTRRQLPAGSAHVHPAGGAAHKHFNPLEAGRLVSLEAGRTELRFILSEDRVVVSVPSAEYANVGFEGSWERAYYMVTMAELARMKPVKRASPVKGAIWYGRDQGGLFERVLWDPALSIARVIESGSVAGDKWFQVSVTPRGMSAGTVPWRRTQGYEQKRYSDFLD